MVLTSDNNHNHEKLKFISIFLQQNKLGESIGIVYFKAINFFLFYGQNDEMGGFNFVYNYKL